MKLQRQDLGTNPTPFTRRLGDILSQHGHLTASQRLDALSLHRDSKVPLGEVCIANGFVCEEDVLDALGMQRQLPKIDPDRTPPDRSLAPLLSAQLCQTHGLVPWRRDQKRVLVATCDPTKVEGLRSQIEEQIGAIRVGLLSRDKVNQEIIERHAPEFASQALHLTRDQDSCRSLRLFRSCGKIAGALSVTLLLAGLVFFPNSYFFLLYLWAIATLILSAGIKLTGAAMHLYGNRVPEPAADAVVQRSRISVMVPLFREARVLPALIERLKHLQYPRALTDIILVLEESDTHTRDALGRMSLPPWIRAVIVPDDHLKTKPRALNYALGFCRGDIIGIWDAEDCPAPDQLDKIAQRFALAGKKTACLQGILDYYNTRSNWLARAFTIEYATWFRLILPGLSRLGFAIPLGGTTMFVRREALEEVGGWDAHNVTEDADLGIRLARYGYRTETIGTVTTEEANNRVWPWIRQRSRWLKGYMITWLVAMRSPRKLWRQLGTKQFLGVQIILLTTVSQFVVWPVLVSFWLVFFGIPHPPVHWMSGPAMNALIILFLISEVISIGAGLLAVSGPDHRHLLPWVPTMHFYFPLGTIAAYKGIWEILHKPFYWDKTAHGVCKFAARPDQINPGAPRPP